MKFPESWLRSLIDPGLDARQIGHLLTMSGLELDALTPAAPPFSNVVVARIAEIAPHPDAAKLRVCQVEDGSGARLQVVCGAPNARAGLVTALARVGAELPNGVQIKQAKLRGVESSGMLCSATELGIDSDGSGILELDETLPLGQSVREALNLDDGLFEVDLTPNRSDCLSVWGIARELGALTGRSPLFPVVEPVAAVHEATFPVHIDAPEACPRYAGRVIRGIRADAATPAWMRERLERSGVRSIAPLVDVTNYVMLEMGQPMHAFDLSRLRGGIRVRWATRGESLTLLDGKSLELTDKDLVIADAGGSLALAGVMGGADSGVNSSTRDVFLESAFFSPTALAGRARAHGLHTESSHRFERGVDFNLQVRAIERATALIVEIAGGSPGPVIERVAADALPVLPVIRLARGRVEQRLGIALDDGEITRILTALGCRIDAAEDHWDVTPPTWRFDLRIEMDLIEELARVYSYDRIPANTRAWKSPVRARPEAHVSPRALKAHLVDLGYQEVVTYSFVDPAVQAAVDPDAEAMRLANPISSELAVMRTTMWPGLIEVVLHNLRRQQNRMRVFEQGLVYRLRDGGLTQDPRLGGAITGPLLHEQWGSPARAVDFYDLKGDIESLLSAAALAQRVVWEPCSHPALHPGQSARLLLDGREIGLAGALHPALAERMDLGQPVYLFDLDIGVLSQGRVPRFQPLSRFPSVRRDLAVVVDADVSFGRVAASVRALQHPLISDFMIFDVYSGSGVASGRKSFALGLILQDMSRTLEDDDVEQTIMTVLAKLNADLGATLRD